MQWQVVRSSGLATWSITKSPSHVPRGFLLCWLKLCKNLQNFYLCLIFLLPPIYFCFDTILKAFSLFASLLINTLESSGLALWKCPILACLNLIVYVFIRYLLHSIVFSCYLKQRRPTVGEIFGTLAEPSSTAISFLFIFLVLKHHYSLIFALHQ